MHLEQCRRLLEGDESDVEEFFEALSPSARKQAAWRRAVDDLHSEGILSDAQAHAYLERGPGIEEHPQEPVGVELLGPAVEAYIADATPRLATLTMRDYKAFLTQFVEHMGAATAVADALSPAKLKAFFKHRHAKAQAASPDKGGGSIMNNVRIAVSAFASYAKQLGIIEHNRVFETIPQYSVIRDEPHVLRDEEIARLIAAAETYTPRSSGKYIRWKALLMLWLETGLRPAEMTHLQWRDVEEGKIRIREKKWQERDVAHEWRPKTWERRTLPISAETQTALSDWRESLPREYARDHSWIVTTGTTVVKRCADPGKRMQGLFETAKVTWGGFYAFRHSAAIRWQRAGFEPQEIQRLLGHKDLSATFGYLNHLPDLAWQEKAAKRLPSWKEV
jgi:integrase